MLSCVEEIHHSARDAKGGGVVFFLSSLPLKIVFGDDCALTLSPGSYNWNSGNNCGNDAVR